MVEVATTSSEIASIIEDDPDNEEDYITTFGPPVNNKNKPTIVLKVIIPIMIYIYIYKTIYFRMLLCVLH